MVTIISEEQSTISQWDEMTDWCLAEFGTPEVDWSKNKNTVSRVKTGSRWGYTATYEKFTLYFNREQDAVLYLLRWGGRRI